MSKPSNQTYIYTSTCCNAPAKKPPCAIEKGVVPKPYLGAKPEGESSLGSWRCSGCRKPCSVIRSVRKNEKKEESVAA